MKTHAFLKAKNKHIPNLEKTIVIIIKNCYLHGNFYIINETLYVTEVKL